MRKYLAFVLLGILTVVGVGAAALGVGPERRARPSLEPGGDQYPQGPELHRVPGGEDAAGRPDGEPSLSRPPTASAAGLQSVGRQTYLFIIGSTEYISVTQPAKGAKGPTVFYTAGDHRGPGRGPGPHLPPYYDKGTSTRSGSVTTVTLTQGGQTEKLTYTVTGNYVSNFKAATPGGTINLAISDVGSPRRGRPAQGLSRITTTVPADRRLRLRRISG